MSPNVKPRHVVTLGTVTTALADAGLNLDNLTYMATTY
jgi:hypothetical protein